MIKKPSPNMDKYQDILNRGFKRFPERKNNYEKYLENERQGFKGNVDYLPIKMDYEVSSICNFRCTMCLMSEVSDKRPPNMTLEDFRKSIDEQKGLVEVKLQGLGEPLLNRAFFEMAEYAVAKDLWVRTTTNASLLHVDDNYKKMIDSGIGEIQVSLDGAKKNTFEKIRVGSDFNRIVDNIRLLNDYAESKGELWKTSCWVMLLKDNLSEIEDILSLAIDLKFRRIVFQMSPNDFGKDEWKEKNGAITVNDNVDSKTKERLFETGRQGGADVSFWDTEGMYTKGDSCPWLFNRAYITAQMRITPCCMYWQNDICDLGDARDFSNAWKSDEYEGLRKLMRDGGIPDICHRCYGVRSHN